MSEIIKFTDYTEINENVIIPVVDAVISDSGILNTKTATGLPLKGSVELNTIPVFDIETGKKVMAVSRTVGQDSKAQKTKKVVSGIKGNDGKYYPHYNAETMETNVPGLYLAGAVVGGMDTHVWFIENSRVHAEIIGRHMALSFGK